MEQNLNAAVYPDLREELPGVEIASHDQTLLNDHVPLEYKPELEYDDPNDIAEASAQSSDDFDRLYDTWLIPETNNQQPVELDAENVIPNQDILEDKNANENAGKPTVDRENVDNERNKIEMDR